MTSRTITITVSKVLIAVLIAVLVITFSYSRKKIITKYYKHPSKKLGQVQEDIFKQYNFTESVDWTLYIPRTYNTIEEELLTIKTQSNKHSNKFVFGINGCDNFVSKNGLWIMLVNKYGTDFAAKLMPRSYILYKQSDLELFKYEYISGKAYIMKKNIQRKEGLKLTSSLEEIIEGGSNDYKVVQEYMDNIFLVNSRKLNIRVYILIVYDKTPQAYMYKHGKCIYTNKEYNGDIYDIESNITSYKMDTNVYKKSPFTTDELDIYIKSNTKSTSIQPIMNKIMNHMKIVCNPIINKLVKSENLTNHTTFQLFGCDIILDNNLNPFLLEFNKGPEMKPKCAKDYKLKYKIYTDMYNKVGLIASKNNHFIQIS